MPHAPIPSLAPAESLDWGLLRAFVAVVRAGSLSAAAERLHVTQPTVGRQIRALEDSIGEALFDRMPQGLRPTERALSLFEHAAALEQAAATLTAAMAGHPEAPTGPVRITANEPFGVERLPQLLQPLLEENPGITIELVATMEVQNLLRRDADIAIRFKRPEQEDLIARRVSALQLGLFASEEYVERHGKPESLADLLAHRMVGPDRGQNLMRALTALGLNLEGQPMAFRSDSMLALEAAMRAGIGIGFMHVDRALRRPGLLRVLPEAFAPTLPVWLVAHSDVRQGRRYRLVFDYLAEVLPREFRVAA